MVFQFEQGVQGSNITSFTDALWWGIVTMLTVGYGDRFPVTPWGRVCASVMMVCGVAGTGIVTAKVSSVFLEKALRDRRGLVDTSTLKNHFIICGWKNEMNTLLSHILASNPNLKAENILLVNNAPEMSIEALLEDPELKKVKTLRGDFFAVDILKRAVPEKAKKVLILADATPGLNGLIPTTTEADARTVMTAMTLNNISKGTPVAAEILDAEMDQYLKLAQVHEVIYSKDYSRMLLALSSTGTGITNIFHDLLDPHSDYSLSTVEVPADIQSQTYKQLKEIFLKNHPEMTLIGLLTNSGNSHHAKEKALKKAQQTPNIRELVENLQSVKNLRFNKPIFSPSDDFILSEGTMAIVIQQREQRV